MCYNNIIILNVAYSADSAEGMPEMDPEDIQMTDDQAVKEIDGVKVKDKMISVININRGTLFSINEG